MPKVLHSEKGQAPEGCLIVAINRHPSNRGLPTSVGDKGAEQTNGQEYAVAKKWGTLIPTAVDGATVDRSIRDQIVRDCRQAEETLGVFRDYALQLIVCGEALLNGVSDGASKEMVVAALREAVQSIEPVLPRCILVERDAGFLVSGSVKGGQAAPEDLIETRRREFAERADEVIVGGLGTLHGLVKRALYFADEMGCDLCTLRDQYREDLRLFYRALPPGSSHEASSEGESWREDKRYTWLQTIERNSKRRTAHVDSIVQDVGDNVIPCLQKLNNALEALLRDLVLLPVDEGTAKKQS